MVDSGIPLQGDFSKPRTFEPGFLSGRLGLGTSNI